MNVYYLSAELCHRQDPEDAISDLIVIAENEDKARQFVIDEGLEGWNKPGHEDYHPSLDINLLNDKERWNCKFVCTVEKPALIAGVTNEPQFITFSVKNINELR